MKSTGILLVLVGVIGGLWLGVWWGFIGGIVQGIDALSADPVNSWGIAFGAARVFVVPTLAIWVGFILTVIGVALYQE